ncbi:uncharacterized protein LOC123500364 isoform X2 [Portunus trituberculatus]|uniref:uncharacterized protein LOC123500364 isoform X2 n=1 Tax=Portunus trituberculatus TaxID=210409 RepID=UPI001E1CE278|nr:uncharacterized protein LOC123500364 isoform X2 [Portunus trituberculatus]
MPLELFHGIVNLLQDLDYEEIQEIWHLRLPRAVLQDRSDPMVYLTEEEFIQRYRLSKDGVRDVLEEITPYLGRIRDGRGQTATRNSPKGRIKCHFQMHQHHSPGRRSATPGRHQPPPPQLN